MNKPPQLQISLDEVPEPGLRVVGDLPESWLEESLLSPYTPTGPVKVELEVRCMGGNVLVQGQMDLVVGFSCSRTGRAGTSELNVMLNELFQPAGSHTVYLGQAEVSSEDLGTDEPFVYEGNRLDLEPFVREHLVLAQDPFPTLTDATASPSGVAAWSSRGDEVDPRWAKLKDLELA